MTVNPLEIRALIAEAMSYINTIERLRRASTDVELYALRWVLYASLQNLLDAAAMIIAELGLRKPGSYSQLGVSLHESGLISEDARDSFKKIALVRNTLAHAYRRLSEEDLRNIVENMLPIARSLADQLLKIVENRDIDPPEGGERSMGFESLAEVFEKHSVLIAYLFGSRARGVEREDSDYDIAVLFNKERVSIINEVELAIEIADRLGIPADKVDLVALNRADRGLISRILREAKVIYSKNESLRKKWERRAYLEVLRETDLDAIYTSRLLLKTSEGGER